MSDDDLDLRDLSDEEIDRAFDLWFDLAQHTNDSDPTWTHGVFLRGAHEDVGLCSTHAETYVPPADSADSSAK